jgi:hypothetical protein
VNPTSDEKRLLDENNWCTNVELGGGLTHNDRVKNIIVFAPEEVLQLKEKIDREKNYLSQYQYPPNLLDENSFGSRLGKVWMSFRSFTSRKDLKEQYRQLYYAGKGYQQLAFKAVTDAEQSFDSGNMEDARTFLNQAYRYEMMSAKSFAAAAELIDRNLESLEKLTRIVAKGCELTVRCGIKIVLPAAAPLADAIYLGINFGVTMKLEGVDQAVKDALIDAVLQSIFLNWKFVSLGDNTLLEYVNRVSEFVPLDTLLANEQFMQEFGTYLRVVLNGRVDNAILEGIVGLATHWLASIAESRSVGRKSPVDIRVFDSKGRVTGLINGVVKHEIPMSLYYNGTVTISFPSDTYCFEVEGTDEGAYGLEITSVRAGNVTKFTATDIPTSSNTTHQYTIDWVALSLGEEGVTVEVDSDGDGRFEKTLTSDSELTDKEFMFPMRAIFTFNDFWEGVNYSVILSSSNSTITNFIFNQPSKQISFEVSGEKGNSGYCNVTIPKTLLRGEPWIVRVNGTNWNFVSTSNGTHSFLYFTYTHASTFQVVIQGTWVIPEFPPFLILPLFMVATLLAVVVYKRKHMRGLFDA